MTHFILAAELGNFAILLGVVLLVALMLRMTYRKQRNPGPTPSSFAREQLAKLKEEHAVKGNLEELMVQLQELSREINAQIDTKFAKLEASIRSADERIDTLYHLLRGRAQEQPTVDTIISDDGAGEEPPPDESGAEAPDSPRAKIYALADSGKSAVEIAHHTGQAPGEIELILSLRGR